MSKKNYCFAGDYFLFDLEVFSIGILADISRNLMEISGHYEDNEDYSRALCILSCIVGNICVEKLNSQDDVSVCYEEIEGKDDVSDIVENGESLCGKYS